MLVSLFILLAGTAAPASSDDLHFEIPPGWLDLSPGAPEKNFAGIPAEMARLARASRFAAAAFDLAGAQNGYASNFTDLVTDETTRIGESDVQKVADALVPETAKGQSSERGRIQIGSVGCLRAVFDSDQQGHPLRHLVYVMPAGSRTAILTFTARREAFDRYLAAFERVAHATQGLS